MAISLTVKLLVGQSNNFTPAYDNQQSIYDDLLGQLDKANDLLAGAGSLSGDIIYNNDATKWQKLANSLSLRLLMHASNQLNDVGSRFSTIVNNRNLINK